MAKIHATVIIWKESNKDSDDYKVGWRIGRAHYRMGIDVVETSDRSSDYIQGWRDGWYSEYAE